MLQVEQNTGPTEIRFTSDWMGARTGSTKKVWSGVAKYLVGRGVAEYLDKPESTKIEKALDSPPRNKMVARPERKKSLRSF